MASLVSSFLLPFVVLVTECYCAPGVYGVGGTLGGVSELDLNFGGRTDITRDGLAFTADSKNNIGAKWQGKGYGGGYAQLDKKFYGGAGSVAGVLGPSLTPNGRFAFGIDSKGNIPVEFNPHLGVNGEASLMYGGNLFTGDEARQLAGYYGAFGALNGPSSTQKALAVGSS